MLEICSKLAKPDQTVAPLFQPFDATQDGMIHYDEFSSTIRTIELDSLSDTQIYQVFYTLDANRDGKIDLWEFVTQFYGSLNSTTASRADVNDHPSRHALRSELLRKCFASAF